RHDAALDADLEIVPAHAGHFGDQNERLSVLAQVHRGAPAREAPGGEVAPAEDRLQETVHPFLETDQVADRVPRNRRARAARRSRRAPAHRLVSSTSTYSASITSPSFLSPPVDPDVAPPGAVASPGPWPEPDPAADPNFWYRDSA